jgi:hypothetical protein
MTMLNDELADKYFDEWREEARHNLAYAIMMGGGELRFPFIELDPWPEGPFWDHVDDLAEELWTRKALAKEYLPLDGRDYLELAACLNDALREDEAAKGKVVHVGDVANRDNHYKGRVFLRHPYVYIGRFQFWGAGRHFKTSIWGNPFPVKTYGLAESLRLYEEYVRNSPELMARLPELEGKILACWCTGRDGAPRVLTADDPLWCHGQILLRLVEGGEALSNKLRVS